MPEYLSPGVYVEEVDTGNKPIEGVSTSTVGFLGIAERGPTAPTFLGSFSEYGRTFGSYLTRIPAEARPGVPAVRRRGLLPERREALLRRPGRQP